MLFFLPFLFLFSLPIASFLAVIIHRLHLSESFIKGRSRCPKCKKIIAWYDNLPLISFILLKGRCRHCRAKIGWEYPLLEFSFAFVITLFFYFLLGNQILPGPITHPLIFFATAVFIYLTLCSLFVIFVYDLKHSLIPNGAVYFGLAAAFLYRLFLDLGNPASSLLKLNLISGLIGALVAGGFFFILVFISREKWMGWGDVYLGALLGFWLGIPQILVGLFLAYLSGSIIGVALILFGHKKPQSAIPFGPFLIFGALIAFLWGEYLFGLLGF